ncbi:hypothetical protein JXA63_00865 [Candidatus Woesebacteria bacterium]|nr:hypothetical protein [Candidatus Woesebacteria bacterium]
MNNYRSDRDRGRNFRRNSDDRGGRREMFDAVCANCGNDCKIPFQPRNDKPVYCSDCFEKMGGGDDRNSGRRSRRDDSRRTSTSGFRSGGFDKNEFEKLNKGIEAMNKKLDKIIILLSPADVKEKSEPEAKKKKEAPKEKALKTKKPAKKEKKESK